MMSHEMRRRMSQPRRAGKLLLAGLTFLVANAAMAQMDDVDRARRMHDRIAGVPPSPAVLTQMANYIGSGQADLAAGLAMQNPAFYNVALKNFVTPWTNVDRTVFRPLNDYTATVIGMIRDDVPFNTVLSEDIVYTGANNVVTPNYEQTSNAHYEALEAAGVERGAADRHGLEQQVTVVPVGLVKGLELDASIVVEPAAIVREEPQGMRSLYVALTRATKRLTLVHAEPLPDVLR